MVVLRAQSAPLLKQIDNKPRAVYDRQHQKPPSSRGSSNASASQRRNEPDVDDDPISSSSESDGDVAVQPDAHPSSSMGNGKRVGKSFRSSFKEPHRRSKRELPQEAIQETDNSSRSSIKRQKSNSSVQEKHTDEDDFWQICSQSQQSRNSSSNTKGYGKSSQKAYGSSGPSSSAQVVRNLHTALPGKLTNGNVKAKPSSAGKSASTFKTVPELPLLDDNDGRTRVDFKRPEGLDDLLPSSQVNSSGVAAADILKELDEEAALAAQTAAGAEDDEAVPSGKVKCPYCKDIIDSDFLDDHDEDAKWRWRDVEEFCLSHRRRDAQASYKERGYDKIKWRKIETRFQRQKGNLRLLVDGKQPSYFRNELEEQLQSRRGRKNKPDLEMAGAGYYGPRGSRRMLDWLQRAFQERMVGLAAKDALVKDIGKSTFLQAVMVPELAVMLIMEDMGCDVERARATLRESSDVGDLVNAEEEEHVTARHDDDDVEDDGEAGAPQVIDLS